MIKPQIHHPPVPGLVTQCDGSDHPALRVVPAAGGAVQAICRVCRSTVPITAAPDRRRRDRRAVAR